MTENKIEANMGVLTAGQAFIEAVIADPILTSEGHAQLFASNLRAVVTSKDFEALAAVHATPKAEDEFWDQDDYMTRNYRPYQVEDGVLTIPVYGSLVNRVSYQYGRYMTGYEYISRALSRGMADPAVDSILFHIDSPGGQAAGNFELCDEIVSARGTKPMVAVSQDLALSGGYSIATAADELVVAKSGYTGSVGVVVMHMDFSKMLSNAGIGITFIQAGKHKTDGNPYEPLSEQAMERIQAGVDKFYGVFVSTVANNRGITEDTVRKTEALVYDSDESVEVGFADRIGGLKDEHENIATQTKGPNAMADKDSKTTEITAADVATARADERARFASVLGSDEAKGREDLANHLLATTDMDAAAITATLKVSPKVEAVSDEPKAEGEAGSADAQAGDRKNHFKEHMDATGGAGVEGGEGGGNEQIDENSDEALSASILGSYVKAGGRVQSREKT